MTTASKTGQSHQAVALATDAPSDCAAMKTKLVRTLKMISSLWPAYLVLVLAVVAGTIPHGAAGAKEWHIAWTFFLLTLTLGYRMLGKMRKDRLTGLPVRLRDAIPSFGFSAAYFVMFHSAATKLHLSDHLLVNLSMPAPLAGILASVTYACLILGPAMQLCAFIDLLVVPPEKSE